MKKWGRSKELATKDDLARLRRASWAARESSTVARGGRILLRWDERRAGDLRLQQRRVSSNSRDPQARVIWTVVSRREANEVCDKEVRDDDDDDDGDGSLDS